jgi:hypothetical protein
MRTKYSGLMDSKIFDRRKTPRRPRASPQINRKSLSKNIF